MKKKTSFAYKIIKGLIWVFSPHMKVVGAEKLPEKPCIVVGNHTQMYGPVACELYFPGERYTWCAGEMMKWREVPGYAFQDFWSGKPASVRWLYRILAYLIVPLSVILFNNANTIPVYRDHRLMNTFRETADKLQEGVSVVIFPEHGEKVSNILYDFQEGFVDVARLHYKRTGEVLSFVPLYIAPKLKRMYVGDPVPFDPSAPIREERRRICACMMDGITKIAVGLPRHIVVPYRNIPKKDYPYNVPDEVTEK